jgi:hypothetical protein
MLVMAVFILSAVASTAAPAAPKLAPDMSTVAA